MCHCSTENFRRRRGSQQESEVHHVEQRREREHGSERGDQDTSGREEEAQAQPQEPQVPKPEVGKGERPTVAMGEGEELSQFVGDPHQGKPQPAGQTQLDVGGQNGVADVEPAELPVEGVHEAEADCRHQPDQA